MGMLVKSKKCEIQSAFPFITLLPLGVFDILFAITSVSSPEIVDLDCLQFLE